MHGKLGSAALPFVFADATGEPGLESPVHDASTILYLGHGRVPATGESFAHEALLWKARTVLQADHPLNPFPCVLVMAELA